MEISIWVWLKFHSSIWHECESCRNAKKKYCVPFLISSKRTSILDSYIEAYDSSLAILFWIVFSIEFLNACRRQVFCVHVLWHARCEHWANTTVRFKTKGVVHQFKLNIETLPCSRFHFLLFCPYILANLAHFMAHIQTTKSPQCCEWANELLRLDLDTPRRFY